MPARAGHLLKNRHFLLKARQAWIDRPWRANGLRAALAMQAQAQPERGETRQAGVAQPPNVFLKENMNRRIGVLFFALAIKGGVAAFRTAASGQSDAAAAVEERDFAFSRHSHSFQRSKRQGIRYDRKLNGRRKL